MKLGKRAGRRIAAAVTAVALGSAGVLVAALSANDVRARLAAEGAAPLPGTPEDYAADIDGEETTWGALVRKLNLKVE